MIDIHVSPEKVKAVREDLDTDLYTAKSIVVRELRSKAIDDIRLNINNIDDPKTKEVLEDIMTLIKNLV